MSSKEWISEIEYELKGTSDTSSDAPRKSRINAYKKVRMFMLLLSFVRYFGRSVVRSVVRSVGRSFSFKY